MKPASLSRRRRVESAGSTRRALITIGTALTLLLWAALLPSRASAQPPALTEFDIPYPTINPIPLAITAGPGSLGGLWFTTGGSLGRVTPGNNVILVPGRSSTGIAALPDGTLVQIGCG